MDHGDQNRTYRIILRGHLSENLDMPTLLRQISEHSEVAHGMLLISGKTDSGKIAIQNGCEIMGATTDLDKIKGVQALVRLFSTTDAAYQFVSVDEETFARNASMKVSIDKLFEQMNRAIATAEKMPPAPKPNDSSSPETTSKFKKQDIDRLAQTMQFAPQPIAEAPAKHTGLLVSAGVASVILFGALLFQTSEALSSKLHFGAGVRDLSHGAADLAAQELTQALNADPRLNKAFLFRAIAYGRLGENEKAIADYIEVLLDEPKNVAALVGRASQYLRAKDYTKAIADCDAAINAQGTKGNNVMSPNFADAFRIRGIAEAQDGRYDKAVADCKYYLKIVGENASKTERADALAVLASARMKADEFGAAIDDYSTAIALDPKSVALYRGRALAFKTAGDWANALRDSDAAVKLSADPETLQLRSECYRALGKYPQAIADIQRAMKLNPNDPQLHRHLGDLFILSDRYPDAAKEYRIGLDENPNDPKLRARFNLAMSKTHVAGNAVLADIERAETPRETKTYSGDARTLIATGYDLMNKGQPAEAVAALTVALKSDPNNQQARQYLAHALIQCGRPADAAAQFAQLEKLRALDPKDLAKYGRALQDSNQLAAAISVYERCLAAEPTNNALRSTLIDLCTKQGDSSKALRLIQDGLSKTQDAAQRLALEAKQKELLTPKKNAAPTSDPGT